MDTGKRIKEIREERKTLSVKIKELVAEARKLVAKRKELSAEIKALVRDSQIEKAKKVLAKTETETK